MRVLKRVEMLSLKTELRYSVPLVTLKENMPSFFRMNSLG
jgi:hypothetical protein